MPQLPPQCRRPSYTTCKCEHWRPGESSSQSQRFSVRWADDKDKASTVFGPWTVYGCQVVLLSSERLSCKIDTGPGDGSRNSLLSTPGEPVAGAVKVAVLIQHIACPARYPFVTGMCSWHHTSPTGTGRGGSGGSFPAQTPAPRGRLLAGQPAALQASAADSHR